MTAHRWKTDDDGTEPDTFAYECGYHNGPVCDECGFYFCHHCDPDGYGTECGTKPMPGHASKLGSGYAYSEAIRSEYGLPQIGRDG